MKQVFKFDHKTVIYHGNGQYTVTADQGFILREQGTDNLSLTAYTRDYSRFEAIANEEIQEHEPANEENQKQEPANETRKKAAEEQPQPTKAKKGKKTTAGK